MSMFYNLGGTTANKCHVNPPTKKVPRDRKKSCPQQWRASLLTRERMAAAADSRTKNIHTPYRLLTRGPVAAPGSAWWCVWVALLICHFEAVILPTRHTLLARGVLYIVLVTFRLKSWQNEWQCSDFYGHHGLWGLRNGGKLPWDGW